MSGEQRAAEELSAKVADYIIDDGIYEGAMKMLLQAVRARVHEATLQALLNYRLKIAIARDEAWAREIISLWTPSDAENVTLPTDRKSVV